MLFLSYRVCDSGSLPLLKSIQGFQLHINLDLCVSDIIESMVKMKMAVDAVDIAYTFGLEDKVSPEAILTSFLREAKELWKRTKRSSQGLITAVVRYVLC